MHKQWQLWNFIHKNWVENIPVMLLYVLESKGSSPGRQGFAMAVNANNEMVGSIGGGMMEHKLVELAKTKILDQHSVEGHIIKQIHNKSAVKYQSGMICSGEQTVYLHKINATDIPAVLSIIQCLDNNNTATLIITNNSISCELGNPSFTYSFQVAENESFTYKEKIGYKNYLTIIGGGHCALAFSKLMQSMDYYIQIIEERASLNTLIANNYVHEKHIVENYSDISALVDDTKENHFVVIMTFGYRTDTQALLALQNKQLTFLGMLGSQSKTKKLLEELNDSGINFFTKVTAPVGMSINSQTPEEIAISIAAQIIGIKNKAI